MPKLSGTDKSQLIDDYRTGHYRLADLCKKYLVTRPTVDKYLREAGITRESELTNCPKMHPFNEKYFEKIDSEEKAYFLGLLYSNGNLSTSQYLATISLQSRDVDILKGFSRAIESTRPISVYAKKNPKHQPLARLVMRSKQNWDNLFALGCVPAKSLILRFPAEEQVPRNLIRHFVRGYFCGNGSLSLAVDKKGVYVLNSSVVSTESFCRSLKNIIAEELNIHAGIRNNGVTTVLAINGACVARTFLNWIYAGTDLCIKRKFDKFKDAENKIDARRAEKFVKIFGEAKSLTDWSKDPRCKVRFHVVWERIDAGWSPEEALTTPKQANYKIYSGYGENKTIFAWSKDPRCTVSYHYLKKHLQSGIPVEQALPDSGVEKCQ